MSDSTELFSLSNAGSQINYWDGSVHNIYAGTANHWYHFKIDFDCSTDTFSITIDGVEEVSGASFATPASQLNEFNFRTESTHSGFYHYFDAIGYSWDPNYNIGDNFNEGLLLSFENSTVLDWTGYSLDGAANITIQGNTTIPMPTGNKLHSIQVFGTTSEGKTLQSDIRYFSLDWEYICLRPTLNILDMINEFGLYIEIDLNSIGFLQVGRQSFTFPGLPVIGYNQSTSYFYGIDLRDAYFLEDTSIVSSITIRFYYNPSEINNPGDLHLYHYISSTGQWRSEDIYVNTTHYYVEFKTTELSYFCLSEISIPIIPIPWFIIIIIIILSTIGLSIPSGYVIISRRKNKKRGTYQPERMKDPGALKTPPMHVEKFVQINIVKPRISPDMITPIKSVESKKSSTPEKGKKAIKNKKEDPKILDVALSQKIIEEIKKTESEIKIDKEIDRCIVHKGHIVGLSFVCPKCYSKYCINCAQTLEDRQERCWVCDTPIKISHKQERYSSKSQKKLEKDIKDTYKIKRENLMQRFQKGGNLTTITDNFWEIVNTFDWEENDKEEFIKEMLSLTPKERQDIIDLMAKGINKKPLHK